MNPEMTEILIGKFIDSEITPAEKNLLDIELQRNPQARQLLGELQELHEVSRQALDREVSGNTQSAEVVFERAWRNSRLGKRHRSIHLSPMYRIMVSLAAGLVFGFGLYHLFFHTPAQAQHQTRTVTAIYNSIRYPSVPLHPY